MMGRRDSGRNVSLLTVALVVLVVLSGCNGVGGNGTTTVPVSETATPGPTTTITTDQPSTVDTETVASTNADRSTANSPTTTADRLTLAEKGVNPNATWNRTIRLLGVNGTRPSLTVSTQIPDPSSSYTAPSFFRQLVGPPEHRESRFQAITTPAGVTFSWSFVRNASRADLESVLVHEYTHDIQYERGWVPKGVDDSAPIVRVALIEGMAEYVRTKYAHRYLGGSPLSKRARNYANASTYRRYTVAPYLWGARYYDRRVDSPRNVSTVIADPPTTSEQLLHDTNESARPLDVSVDYSANRWRIMDNEGGELTTRIILRDKLSKERALSAAAGWGNDQLLRFQSPWRNESGIVWVHRWDSPQDAGEFAEAAQSFLEARRAESDRYHFSFQRLAPETTAIVVGDGGFTDSLSVETATNASVTVSVPD